MTDIKWKGKLFNALKAWGEEKSVSPETSLKTGLDKGLYHAVTTYLPIWNKDLEDDGRIAAEQRLKNQALEKENLELKRIRKEKEYEFLRIKAELESREMAAFLKKYDGNEAYQVFLSNLVRDRLVDSYSLINDRLQISWTIGGTAGGSCWDTGDCDPHYSRTADEEPEFELLDKLLEHFHPDVSMIKYKKLMRECVERTEHSENEYYGNHTDYAVKKLNLLKFYEFLVSEKCDEL